MKNPEINALVLGRLMCLSALIESEVYQTSTAGEALQLILGCLVELYRAYDFLRESIQTVFIKLLKNASSDVAAMAKIMEKIVAELIVAESKQTSIKEFVYAHSDNLSLFLSLRHIFLGSPKLKD